MDKELFLNDAYIAELTSADSIIEALPHLLSRLPVHEISTTPQSEEVINALRQDSDSIHAFIVNHCVINMNAVMTKTALYENYAKFCIESGREAHKKHTFIRHLKSKGFQEHRNPTTREACWKGIGIKKVERS